MLGGSWMRSLYFPLHLCVTCFHVAPIPLVPLTSIFLPLLLSRSTMALAPAKWKVSLDGLPTDAASSNESMPLLLSGVASTTPPSIRLIDWREWQTMRSLPKSGGTAAVHGTMLIVAADEQASRTESVPESELEDLVQSTTPGVSPSTTSISSPPSTTAIATTIPTTITTTTSASSVMINSNETGPSMSTSSGDDAVALPPMDLRGLPIIMALLKQLTMLPVMIKSLTGEQSPNIIQRAESLDPTGGGPPPDPFRSLLSSAGGAELEGVRNGLSPHIHPLAPRAAEDEEGDGREEKLFSFRRYASGVPTATGGEELRESQPQPIVPAITTESGQLKMSKGKAPSGPSPSSSRHLTLSNNIYGLNDAATTHQHQHQHPTNTYEAPRMPHKKPRPKFDFSALTVDEVGQLESIHKKLFNEETGNHRGDRLSPLPSSTPVPPSASPPPISTPPSPRAIRQQFNSPGTLPTPMAGHLQLRSSESDQQGSRSVGMDAAALKDIAAIRDLPDLDEITKGMDLRLLNKPGGFAILKQQFIERLAQRTLNGGIR